MSKREREGICSDLVAAAEKWVESFVATSLPSSDTADLVAGALKADEAVSRAAAQLTWLTGDTFVDAMRRAEQHDDR